MPTILNLQASLKPSINKKIRQSKHLKNALMYHFNISNSTLQLWLNNNSNQFTQYGSLQIIMHALDINKTEDLLTIEQVNEMPM